MKKVNIRQLRKGISLLIKEDLPFEIINGVSGEVLAVVRAPGAENEALKSCLEQLALNRKMAKELKAESKVAKKEDLSWVVEEADKLSKEIDVDLNFD